ncbi:hypothetical protein HCA58_05090 [Micromonospora sp. HNM0581]|uniref:hypothetical protein n=1 Tax=Micromonospora sp. HNM0581 TaxID=2716341 RepID=UPI00146E0DBA|nr:hypothetical protein [Micromonospora sp. HNM0581]NLU77780.1 hypothetical protein [Micromonospora sp. HNM0581]
MGLRALVGTEGAGGFYQARHVQHDACPTMVVPALSALVHELSGHNVQAAVDELLRSDWSRLYALPGTGIAGHLVGVPSPADGEPLRGHITTENAGDREWAYLFGGHRLHVYLGVFPEVGPKRWRPWACWSVHELPSLRLDEVLTVQKAGYSTQWRAADYRQHMAAVREHIKEVAAR